MERIEGAMATPDGLWLVEALRERQRRWYRITYRGEIVQEGLSIGGVEWFLDRQGVDRATLIPVEVPPAGPTAG